MIGNTQPPHWEWYFVATYFFIGGVSAGAFFIGSLAQLMARHERPEITRIAYYIAFPLILLTPPLLIADLGRPERFWHLFFYVEGGYPYINFQSPLSVGSWALLLYSIHAFGAFLDNLIHDGFFAKVPLVKPLTNLFSKVYHFFPRTLNALVGSAAGFFVAGYTGVLVNTTAVPLWQAMDPLLGALFIASAASTGAAAIALVMAIRRARAGESLVQLERFDRFAMLFELVLIVIILLLPGTLGLLLLSIGDALVFLIGAVLVGIVVPLAMNWVSLSKGAHASSSSLIMGAAILALIGGVLLRISIVQAGQVLG